MYDKEIIYVLMEAGSSGLSVKKISRHVHNAHNSLFHPVPFNDVHKYVQKYVLAHSRYNNSILEKVGKGRYRINGGNTNPNQLLLDFKENDETYKEKIISQAPSLFNSDNE